MADGEVERTLGELTLSIRRVPQEIWIRGSHRSRPSEPDDWMRWSVGPSDVFDLRPGLPDRPVVVSPEQPFNLPPRAEALVYVRLPLSVRLFRRDPAGAETVVAELPSLILSDTWWGSHTEGELAYWLATTARRSAPAEIFMPHLAICPLLLANLSTEALPVERFAIRTAHLTLFGHDEALWTDEVHVRYQGASEGSELRYTGEVPREAGHVTRIAPPRAAPPRRLHARTFGRLRALAGW